jgi:hypothetical protein
MRGNATIVVKVNRVRVWVSVKRNLSGISRAQAFQFNANRIILILEIFPGLKTNGLISPIENGVSSVRLLLKAIRQKNGSKIVRGHRVDSISIGRIGWSGRRNLYVSV